MALFTLHGCIQGAFKAPSAFQALVERCGFNADLFGPFRDGTSLSVPFDPFCASRVAVLLNGGGPSAILWSVCAVIVNALDGVFRRWPVTHVFKEVFKYIPSFAHSDASRPVVTVVAGRWNSASRTNGSPRRVLWTARHSVPRCGGSDVISGLASAMRRAVLSCQHLSPNSALISAIAKTDHESAPVRRFHTHHQERSEFTADKVTHHLFNFIALEQA